MPIATTNPATGETVRTFEAHDASAVAEKLQLASDAFVAWRRRPVAERAAVVARAAQILDRDRETFARLMTLEMGKPIQAGRDEAAKCAVACRYYAEHAQRFLASETVYDDAEASARVEYQPLGVVLAIMPWNFPFWQVIRFAAPALVAGNVGLLKHSSNVPQCALAIEAIFSEAGAPAGVFQTLLIGSDAVEPLIADARIAAVTLTGSEGAGMKVGAAAGQHLKKSVLELGGSDPFIVMPSADVARAAEVAVTARTINNGQSCIAAKRFIVADSVADEFERAVVARMQALRVGDPAAPETQVGPLATGAIRDELAEQVRKSVEMGARVLTGGRAIDGPGFYYQPTVLADVPEGAPAFDEELFGPVATITRVRDVDDAIRVANATTFGLGSSAWTNDDAEARRFAEEIEAGQVFINAMVASDPRLPFGGVKRSGYGRELGPFGLREFVNVKTVRTAKTHAGGGAQTE
jgi:succinate-semialdehyde dehydrogenase / glutarate-semialdehyde dehydrogenase